MASPALTLLTQALVLKSAVAGFIALEPYGDSVVVQGSSATAQWTGASGAAWKNMTITLMTGNNDELAPMGVLATDIDATTTTKCDFAVPEVEPNSPIYFLQFSANDESAEKAWTSRFCIGDGKGGKPGKPDHDKQPNGDKTPWGMGHMRGHEEPKPTPHKEHSKTEDKPPPKTVVPPPSVVTVVPPPSTVVVQPPPETVTKPPPVVTSKEGPPPVASTKEVPPPIASTKEIPPPIATTKVVPPPVATTKEQPPPPVVSTKEAPPPVATTAKEQPPPPAITSLSISSKFGASPTIPASVVTTTTTSCSTTAALPSVVTRTEDCSCSDKPPSTVVPTAPPPAPTPNPSGGSKIPAGPPTTLGSAGSKKPAAPLTTGASLPASCPSMSYSTSCRFLTATLTGTETALGVDCSTIALGATGNVAAGCSALGTGQAQTNGLIGPLQSDLANATSSGVAGQAQFAGASERTAGMSAVPLLVAATALYLM